MAKYPKIPFLGDTIYCIDPWSQDYDIIAGDVVDLAINCTPSYKNYTVVANRLRDAINERQIVRNPDVTMTLSCDKVFITLEAAIKARADLISHQREATHGGKREGAGRKAKAPREVLYARVAEGTVDKLRAMAEAQRCTVGDVIEKLLKK